MFTRKTAATHRPKHGSVNPEPLTATEDRSFHEQLEASLIADGPEDPDVVPLGPLATMIRRIILIGALPVFSVLYLWQALTITVPARALAVSPRSFPIIVGAFMCFVTLVIAVVEARRLLAGRIARAHGQDVAPEIDDDHERITSWRDAWVTVAALVAYVAVFTGLGFFISTVVFLVALSTWFAPRRVVRNVLVSAAFSYGVDLLFVNVLNVRLPEGLLAGVM